jgi:Glycosyl transferase 4-like domain
MRILMLVPEVFYSTRGTPLSAYHRTRELVRSGYDVDVLTYPLGSAPPDLSAPVFRARGPRLFEDLPAGPSYRKLWFDVLLALSLMGRLWRQRYDLIYAHEEGGFIASVMSHLFGVPYVYDMHSSLPLQVIDWGFSRNRAIVGCFRWAERSSRIGTR